MADSHASDCRTNEGASCDCGARIFLKPLKAFKFLIGQRGRELDGITYSGCLGIAIARDVEEARALLFAALEPTMGVHAGWIRVATVTELPIDAPGVLGWSMT